MASPQRHAPHAPIVPGHEVAGVVDTIGPGVSGVAVGDQVFGFIDIRRDGADAEYVAVGPTSLPLSRLP